MRERINRLAKGIIDSEIPILEVSASAVEGTVPAGASAKGDLWVSSSNGLHVKGLAYSSNVRVKVLSNAFGGLRNRLQYQVDSSYLEDGEVIQGVFYLVTSAGEREIPYSFQVELGTSGKTLKGLQSAMDFAQVAQRDGDMAQRLFEYQDFVEAPFMKELRARTLYDGFRGKPDRRNGLEEFLVALGVKEPVGISVDCSQRLYDYPLEVLEDSIRLKAHGWGYLCLEAKAEGDFIQLPKRQVTDGDFKEGKCDFMLHIHPSRLHRGRNFGRVTFCGSQGQFVIPIEVLGDETTCVSQEEPARDLKGICKYAKTRLDYHLGLYEPALLLNQMEKQLEEIGQFQGIGQELALLRAENHLQKGRKEEACQLLDQWRDAILSDRQDQVETYCFYQYLRLLAIPNESQKESLVRLLNKYLEEADGHNKLFFILLKLDPSLFDDPMGLLARMKQQFRKGLNSPFLYGDALKLLNQAPELLKAMESFELQVLLFGARHGLAGEELALRAARLAVGARHFNPLFYRLFKLLYQQYPKKELLEAVCCLLIKGECRLGDAFRWYEKGVEERISLTRLYEYYLYSLPKDYHKLLPREVLLYFSYGNELDRHSKAMLYANILTYMKPEDALYQEYERDMEKFAMDQLFESRINGKLAVVYGHMVYKDVIDLPVAKVLPSVLRSYRVCCANPLMKYVILCYEELEEEDAFPLKEGVAYVPLFSENSVILFQDSYGNRYGQVPYEKEAVMERPELEAKCFETFPDHPMLRLRACNQIMAKGVESQEEALLLEKAMDDLKLHPLYQAGLLSAVIHYYQAKAASQEEAGEEGGAWLVRLDKDMLSREERRGICETLIAQNYIEEAYGMISRYGCEGIRTKRLLKLCAKMILQNLFDQDDLLLYLAYQVFSQGKNDGVVLDYLCEHFNGTTDQMYKVLMQGVTEHVETYDLEERLVAQMLFTGAMENIDKVFDLYMKRKKTGENVVKAYFTAKSAAYFIEDQTPGDEVFAYLEGAVNGSIEKEKVPTIYLLALTKYYATLKALAQQQKTLCQVVVDILLEEGLVFPYFKALAKFVAMPGDLMDKGMIQYNGSRNSKIDLEIRILPEDEEFHPEDMRRVYQGIFVKQKVLFEGETMEYRIYEWQDGQRVEKASGAITSPISPAKAQDSRFALLNDMGLCLSLKEEEGLKKRMEEYLLKNAAAEELFVLM